MCLQVKARQRTNAPGMDTKEGFMSLSNVAAGRFWAKVDKQGDCWVWTGARSSGRYGSLAADGKNWRAHRLSYEIHNGPIPDGLYVCHSCDNPPCVNPEHLFLGTQRDNMGDMVQKGRLVAPSGETHGMSRLNTSKVLAIRKARSAGQTLQSIASEHGVGISTIHSVVKRETWKHVI